MGKLFHAVADRFWVIAEFIMICSSKRNLKSYRSGYALKTSGLNPFYRNDHLTMLTVIYNDIK